MDECPSLPWPRGTILRAFLIAPQKVSRGIEPSLPMTVISSVAHSLFSFFPVLHTPSSPSCSLESTSQNKTCTQVFISASIGRWVKLSHPQDIILFWAQAFESQKHKKEVILKSLCFIPNPKQGNKMKMWPYASNERGEMHTWYTQTHNSVSYPVTTLSSSLPLLLSNAIDTEVWQGPCLLGLTTLEKDSWG